MRNLKLIVIGVIILMIVILLPICTPIDNDVFFGIIAAVLTFYFGCLKVRLEDQRIFKELFQEFNNKYDSKMNDLLNELKVNPDRKIEDKDREIIIDYFNLCAEEYLWYKENRILKSVWDAWENGMIANLKISSIKKIFDSESDNTHEKKSYYGWIENISKKINI